MGLNITKNADRPVRSVSELIKENLFTKNPYLDLGNCGLSGDEKDLERLAECEHLETLVFSDSWQELIDKSALNGWVNRKAQNGGNVNQLSYIPALPSGLKKLILFGNKISEIGSLGKLENLRYIDLGFNLLDSFDMVEILPALDTLLLDQNYLETISISAQAPNLTVLSLYGNQLIKCEELNVPGSLNWLDLKKNKLTGSAKLPRLKNLHWLSLGVNQLNDVKGLHELTELNTLFLGGNQIDDVTGLENLTELRVLYLDDNQLHTLNGLCELPNLESLNLRNNLLVDVEGLPRLPKLNWLRLAGNQLTNVRDMPDLPSLKSLDLRHNQLENLEGLTELRTLGSLDLRGNKLDTLSGLPKAQKLTTLDLAENRISTLRDLPDLPGLTTLNLEGNQIDSVEDMPSLPNLTSFDLGSNSLSSLIGFPELPELTFLNLRRNQIKSAEGLSGVMKLDTLNLGANLIANLTGLPGFSNLTALNLAGNQLENLRSLPEMPNLATLEVWSNRLSSLDGMPGLPKLTMLDLWENQLSTLDGLPELPLLTSLYLGYNQFTDGDQIRQLDLLTTLHVLSLYNNPLVGIPREKLGDNRWHNCLLALKDYFKATSSIDLQRPLNEAKLIFVGLGEVGKTELAEALSDENYKFEEGRETTKGIRIKKWRPRDVLKDGKSTDFTVNIWDFAGQEINYGTHQFFLTKNSVYVLVWDHRKGTANPIFRYWLDTVSLLSENSPILVVQNKTDVYETDVNEKDWKDNHSNIRDFYKTSCKQGRGIKELRDEIKKELLLLPHTFEIWNRDRFAIRESLEKDDSDYMSHRQYLRICKDKGLSREQAGFLSEQLHQIGVILHFPDDFELKDTVVLKPEWATQAAYEILDRRQVSTGRFSKNRLNDIWSDEIFDDKHSFLLALMEKFELIFRLNESDDYIVPELLPITEPQLPGIFSIAAQSERYLRFEYHYEFMPKGIMSRFICRQHKWIKDDLFWKFGVVLQLENATALIVNNEVKQIIKIEIVGRDAEKLLFLIRSDFQDLHKKLKNPTLYEKIPCLCSACNGRENAYLHNYETLQRFKDMGRLTRECETSGENVAIKLLLEGILEKEDPYMDELDTLIEQDQIFEFFRKADTIGVLSKELSRMREEFMNNGTKDFQFSERLRVASREWRRNLKSRG